MSFDPYAVMGLEKTASAKDIKAMYRTMSKLLHPDVDGGDADRFKELNKANEILSDPIRRKRYDETGRIDDAVSKAQIRAFITEMMTSVVDAENPDGSTDDPDWEDIQQKILQGIYTSQHQVHAQISKCKLKIKRIKKLLKRFKPLQEDDPVGDALRDQLSQWEDRLNDTSKALELSAEALKVLNSYKYDMEIEPDEWDSPNVTLQITGSTFRPWFR